jgi:hypothetical protein
MMQHQTRRQQSKERRWVVAFTLAIAAATVPAPTADTANAPASSPKHIVNSLDSEPSLYQYRALRRMHAASEKFDHEGWMEAWTELDASGFRYEIVSERGSNTVRNRVLRALLKREQELIAKGDYGRGELTEENYEFGEETSGPDVRYVSIKPKRKDSMLVDGRMVLSPEGELLRVEGVLAKNPSFWTSQVQITRTYARLDGVRVPVAVQSIAKVKFAGRSTLNVDYQYESVNGRQINTAALGSAGAGRPVSER